jgi:hypothetical protein
MIGIKYEQIIERLKGLGYPVAEYEFKDTKKNPAPNPPFIIYFSAEDQTGTDEKNRIRNIQASIELYTDRTPDHDLEALIESKVLFDIDFHKTTAPIQSENMYQTAYDFNVVQKFKASIH